MERDPASSTDSESVPLAKSGKERRPNRLSFLFSVLAVASLIMIPITRGALEDVDRQYANFGGLACGLFALLFGQLAVVAHRQIHWLLKVGVFILPIVAALGFLANYEFSGFNGEVWPTFRSRGSASRTRHAEPQLPSNSPSQAADPTMAELRFAQYLGNRRDGVVESPEFAMDWGKKQPVPVWRRAIGEGWSGFAVANGLAITIFQQGDREVVAGWQLKDGQTAWEYEIPGRHANALGGVGPRSTPTIASTADGDVALVQSALGMVVCLECITGRKLWQLDLLELAGINQEESEKEVMWGRSGSPLVVDDLVVIPIGGSRENSSTVHSLIAVNIATGIQQWLAGESQISYASPVVLSVDGQRQIISVNEGDVTGHEIATGAVLWKSPWPSKSNADACASQPMQVDDSKILLGKGYAQGSKLIEVRRYRADANAEKTTWEAFDVWSNSRVLKTKFTSPIVYDGKAYALSDGTLECVDPMTGTRVWRGSRYGQGQILVVNGAILVSAEDGRIASVDRLTGKPIAEMQVLEGVTWNTPSVAGPFLLVRNGTEAVCLMSPDE